RRPAGRHGFQRRRPRRHLRPPGDRDGGVMVTLVGARQSRAAGWLPRSPLALAALGLLAVLAIVSGLQATFPGEWQVGLAQRIDELDQWWRLNRGENILFTGVFRPLALGVAYGLAEIQAQLA